MEKISVIVPVFNSEDYLRTCLDSILNQTYSNLEIILVNDGSTDSSAVICEEFASKDDRIRLIHKKKGGSGVGATRNTALTYVSGDYIVFVDNDDWLDERHIEILYGALKETNSDVSIAGRINYDDDRHVFGFIISADDYYQKEYTPKEWFQEEYRTEFKISESFTVPWGKLYKAELFRNIKYPENVAVEDDFTTWKIYLMADKIVYTNLGLYFHRKSGHSITNREKRSAVFPLASIEERITLLSLLGFDVTNELEAYRSRLEIHKDTLLYTGDTQEYYNVLNKLEILDKFGK